MTNKNKIGENTEAYKKLKEFVSSKKYLSLEQINNFLTKEGFTYSRETIQKYIQRLKKKEILFSAGRGFYSTIKKQYTLNPEDYQSLTDLIKSHYPLLKFSLWSTKMLAGLFHHTQNQFYTFIYADTESLIFLRDYLTENNYSVFLNPSKNEKNIILKNNTIILRPSITRSKSVYLISAIEKILIDLIVESDRLNLIDHSELQKIFEAILSSYRLNISYLLDYSERRKVDKLIKIIFTKYTNATLLK